MSDVFLTVSEAARVLGVSENMLRKWHKSGKLVPSVVNHQLHYHSGTSLIIFGLLESPDSPGQPAPTLEETLETMFYCEHWPEKYQGPNEADLKELLNRAIRKLQKLNSQPSDNSCSEKTFVKFEPYETLSRVEMKWFVEPLGRNGESVFQYVEAARNRIEAFVEKVTVHGDGDIAISCGWDFF